MGLPRSKPKTKEEQVARFERAAKEAGADKSGNKFERVLKKIIRRSRPAMTESADPTPPSKDTD